MIFLATMLFMIGQVLNMGTSYWVIWGIWFFIKTIKVLLEVANKQPSYLEKRVADKIDQVLDEIKEEN